ncbi:MAG: extracellular solute-binding protein [Bacteroidota bacterium]|jgi:arabinogalactan oligomer/maltooligosaccharide transport system substrate-binding protein
MKKNLSVLFGLLLIGSMVLAACGGSAATQAPAPAATQPPAATQAPATEAPAATEAATQAPAAEAVEVTIWHGYHTGGSEEAALTKLVNQYQADHPNVKVNLLAIPFDQIFNKYETDTAAGGGPDMFTAPNDSLGKEVRASVVAPIDDLVKGKLDGYTQAGINGVTVDGKMYAVPGIAKAVALYYNKDTVPTPPATTDDLMNLVKSGKKIVINQNAYHNYGFWGAFGGKLMDDTGKCVADQGGFADALQYLKDLKAAGALFETDGGKADTEFRQGQADMIINGPWVLGDYKKDLGDKLGVAPMPAGPGGPATPLAGIDGWYINPNSANQQAAVDLALYIFGKDGLGEYANTAGDPPARSDVTITDPLVKDFADAAAAGFPRPQSAEFDNYWGPFGDAVTAVMEGKATPADAVKTACDTMNKANNK